MQKRATMFRGLWPTIFVVAGALQDLTATDPGQVAVIAPAAVSSPPQPSGGKTSALEKSRLARLLEQASLSPGVHDIAKLGDAGAGEGVMLAFVNNSEVAYKLRAEDVTFLRRHNVPDGIITAMIERGAIVRDRPAPPPPAPPVPTVQNVIQWSPSETVNTVAFVPAAPAPPPVSTVTVIGRSDLRHGLSPWNHPYGVARPGMYRNNLASAYVTFPVAYRAGVPPFHRVQHRYSSGLVCR